MAALNTVAAQIEASTLNRLDPRGTCVAGLPLLLMI